MQRLVRAFLVAVVAIPLILVVGGVGFYAGLQKADRQATREVNAMMRLQEQLYRARARDGRFPPVSIDLYERPGLTVSAESDTSVTFYSGVDQTHLVTLHVRGDGTLLTSRR